MLRVHKSANHPRCFEFCLVKLQVYHFDKSLHLGFGSIKFERITSLILIHSEVDKRIVGGMWGMRVVLLIRIKVEATQHV